MKKVIQFLIGFFSILCLNGPWPVQAGPLAEKAERFDRIVQEQHIREGLLIPTIIIQTTGPGDFFATTLEDVCIRSGEYLFALSMRYAVTKDPAARQQARETAQAVINLERVTGTSGCVARMFKRADRPTVDEEAFFFPEEWHQSTSMEGYRWLGDLSVDQLNGWISGLAVYFDLVADEAERKPVSEAMDRVMSRVVANDMRIVDVDGKMTLWGNLSPSLPHEHLNALLGLSDLLCAFHVTGDRRFEQTYERLIREHDYAAEASLAKVLYPEYAINRSDDNLAMEAIYMLLTYETAPRLREYYLLALERHWLLLQDENRSFYDFLREAVFPGHRSIDEHTFDDLRGAQVRPMERENVLMRSRSGEVRISGTWQHAPLPYLRSYWFGRYHGFIAEKE
jgi:hypothetical protein